MSVSQECIDIIIHFCICAYYCKNEWRKNKLNTMHVSPHVDKVYHHLQDLSFPHFLPILFFAVMCYIVSEALRTFPYMFMEYILFSDCTNFIGVHLTLRTLVHYIDHTKSAVM